MLIIVGERNQEYFNKVCAFATRKSAQHSQWLWESLWYLHGYADQEIGRHGALECPKCQHSFVVGDRGVMAGRVKTELYRDFAPASFGVTFFRQDREGFWQHWFEAGLIYHGDQSGWVLPDGRVIGPGDGVDTLSVTLTRPDNPWSLHS